MNEREQIDDKDNYHNTNIRSNSNNEERVKRVDISMPSQRELVSFGAVYKSQFSLLDKIINDYGYGWEVKTIIFSAFLCFILNSYLTASYYSFMLGFKKKFDLTKNQISFIGMGFCLSRFVTIFNRIYNKFIRKNVCFKILYLYLANKK